MRTVAILQARMGSSRLPGKMLLPLLGKPLVQHVLERVNRATTLDAVVLAVPAHDVDAFAPAAYQRAILYPYAGDEADLVGRYLGAATVHYAELIVRIPCDNPCVQPDYIDEAVEKYLARPQVYASTMYRHVRDRIYLDGVGAEVFSMSRLQWLDQATQGQPNYREHPHLLFQDQHLIDGWEQYVRYANVSETIRLDVNDIPGYEFIKTIYTYFGHNEFTSDEIVSFLTTKEVPHEASR